MDSTVIWYNNTRIANCTNGSNDILVITPSSLSWTDAVDETHGWNRSKRITSVPRTRAPLLSLYTLPL